MNRIGKTIFWGAVAATCGGILLLSAAFLYLNPQIPDAATFKDVKIRAPMRIYSADNKLIQEFGERLTPIRYEEIPPLFIRALLDTEDKRFFEHSGIDLITIANATWLLIRNQGSIRSGASTITMQLVKNISGDSQVRFIRKFKEMLLALKIERELTKNEILTLYLNIIPFGKHAFGIQAAANTYYGKDINQLDLAQIAMLAGIPKAPEAGNPINGPERALNRRNLVLQRMLDQQSISKSQFEQSIKAPITASVHQRKIELSSLYVAEMVRKHLLTEYGSGAYNQGLIVHTTIDSEMQRAAEKAIQARLNQYDRRHGYRGPEFRRIQGTDEYRAAPEYGYPANWIASLNKAQTLGNQHPAIVIETRDQEIDVLNQDLDVVTVSWEGMNWARPYLNVNSKGRRPKLAAEIVAVGDLIRIEAVNGSWKLGQVPDIQGALVALDPMVGEIKALVGGFDFNAKQFNHATQARRQPGSNFKPFFYAGAIENGLTAATIYNDAPIVLPGGEQEETYRPRNSGDQFHGKMRLREALYRSINLVSLRVILDYGPLNAINYVSRFGFDTSGFPRDVQLAFGGGTIALTPIDIATGYATFANGGFKVTPHVIKQIDSINEDVVFQASPAIACIEACADLNQASRVVEPRVAYIMNSILSDAIRRGTGTKALRALKRSDLMGKTGTTNDADIWFSGYTHDLVATAWAGFSDNSPVGNREWGSTTPIETWIDFMAEALPPENESRTLARPNGIVTVRINPDTGLRAEPSDPDAIFEIFREEFVPTEDLAKKEDETDPYKQIF
ncbi:MAG: peptidase [Gammaproteobacteria bacterium]|nr:peptidase [Gammaproteobacteria bacterium]|tara:strand:- start:1655 stop:4024 length:2370 start_codon:yes stop_codon:yes gene_type:complete